MQRIICDQLVRCMETHNKNVFAKRVDPHNEMTMRACVEILLKNGRVPVVTVQEIGAIEEHEYQINKSKSVSEGFCAMLYTKLSFVEKDNGGIKQYATIAMPISNIRCAS